MKILVATQKPFSAAAVAGIKEIVTSSTPLRNMQMLLN